ncbi:unnamed protein product [Boreogadus saida]
MKVYQRGEAVRQAAGPISVVREAGPDLQGRPEQPALERGPHTTRPTLFLHLPRPDPVAHGPRALLADATPFYHTRCGLTQKDEAIEPDTPPL